MWSNCIAFNKEGHFVEVAQRHQRGWKKAVMKFRKQLDDANIAASATATTTIKAASTLVARSARSNDAACDGRVTKRRRVVDGLRPLTAVPEAKDAVALAAMLLAEPHARALAAHTVAATLVTIADAQALPHDEPLIPPLLQLLALADSARSMLVLKRYFIPPVPCRALRVALPALLSLYIEVRGARINNTKVRPARNCGGACCHAPLHRLMCIACRLGLVVL